jgi:hypothetical protein
VSVTVPGEKAFPPQHGSVSPSALKPRCGRSPPPYPPTCSVSLKGTSLFERLLGCLIPLVRRFAVSQCAGRDRWPVQFPCIVPDDDNRNRQGSGGRPFGVCQEGLRVAHLVRRGARCWIWRQGYLSSKWTCPVGGHQCTSLSTVLQKVRKCIWFCG